MLSQMMEILGGMTRPRSRFSLCGFLHKNGSCYLEQSDITPGPRMCNPGSSSFHHYIGECPRLRREALYQESGVKESKKQSTLDAVPVNCSSPRVHQSRRCQQNRIIVTRKSISIDHITLGLVSTDQWTPSNRQVKLDLSTCSRSFPRGDQICFLFQRAVITPRFAPPRESGGPCSNPRKYGNPCIQSANKATAIITERRRLL